MVARVSNIDSSQGSVEIQYPVSVVPGPQGAGLMNALFTANPKQIIRLNMNSVAMVASTDEDIKKKYIQATTGIAIPDTKKLILG